VGLIAAQPDMGTALIFVPIYLAGLVLGGVRWKVMLGICLVALLLAPVAWTTLEDYQKERILTVVDPGRDPSGVGYQVRQSKIAIGSGGLLGKGLYQGTQSQLNFLPAQHTDVDRHLPPEPGDDENAQIGTQTILRRTRRDEATVEQVLEQPEHDEHTEKTDLLGEDGKDEVGMLRRQEVELALRALVEALAE